MSEDTRMEFRTKIKTYERREIIDYSSKILLVGSCFAENIYRYLQDRKYDALLNPCGITYNPISIARSIMLGIGKEDLQESRLHEVSQMHYNFDFHGSFSHPDVRLHREKLEKTLTTTRDFVPADVLIISLGTAFVYKHLASGRYVNNCHKLPQSEFDKVLLSPAQIVEVLLEVITSYRASAPTSKVILTVSPVRHIRDGIIENNRSKAAVTLAVMELEQQISDCYYFPSYELLLDDLRDYRYYADDMVHPSGQAVEYIVQIFEEQYLSQKDSELRTKVMKVRQMLSHRLLFPESAASVAFMNKLQDQIQKMKEDYNVDFSKEWENMLQKYK